MVASPSLALLQPMPDAPASAWATRIGVCWQASVKAILEVGRLLSAAKDALPHGEFQSMVEGDLPFGARTAQMLMAIAADPRLTNAKHASLLPPSWTTLYELTKLTDEQFENGIETGAIGPETERRRVIDAARAIAPGRAEPSNSLDYSPTPPWGTRALIEVVMPSIAKIYQAWEPACGEGHIAEVLIENGINVIASDIHPYGYGEAPVDFLSDNPWPVIPQTEWIVTNPPFKAAERFALLALERARLGVALFVRWQWIESVGRYERLFNQFPPTVVAVFAERIPLHMGRWEPKGSTATAYCWIVWHKHAVARRDVTRLFWIPPGQRERLTHPDDVERFTAHPVIKKQHSQSLTEDSGRDHASRIDSENTDQPIADDDYLLGIPDFLRRQPIAAE